MWHWATEGATPDERAKLLDALRPPRPMFHVEQPQHHPGLAPPNIPRPSWYKGDHAAFTSSVRAASDMGLAGVT